MTEWDAAEYSRRSSLQEAMAQEVLALLDLNGPERILDVGCGDGKITAEIAIRVPPASVVGVDPSRDMISFAQSHAWDFGSGAAFAAFCAVGCIEWTPRLPESERAGFINDVLDRYRTVAAERSGEENTFKFYQMDITLLAEKSAL